MRHKLQKGLYQEHLQRQQQARPNYHNGIVSNHHRIPPTMPVDQTTTVFNEGRVRLYVSGMARFFFFLFISLALSALLTILLNPEVRQYCLDALNKLF